MRNLKVVVVAIMLLVALVVGVNVKAITPNEDLLAYAQNKVILVNGKAEKISTANINALKRYLNTHTLTEAQVNTVKAHGDNIVAQLEAAGTTDVSKLSTSVKNAIKADLSAAANVLGLTVNYGNGTITFYEGGKAIEGVTVNKTLANTSSSYVFIIATSALAIVAIAFASIAKKNA